MAYRDPLEGARLRYADLLSRAGEGSSLAAAARAYAARSGRAWAGVAGLAGAAGTVVAVARSSRTPGVFAMIALLVSWSAMALAYVGGARCGAWRARRVALPQRTADVHADLARLEQWDPIEKVRELARRSPRVGTALPMRMVSFLAPLSLHLLGALLLGALHPCDLHFPVSLILVYALLTARTCRFDDATLAGGPRRSSWRYGWVVLVPTAPSAASMLLPPLVMAVTVLFFHPFLYRTMHRAILKERAVLA